MPPKKRFFFGKSSVVRKREYETMEIEKTSKRKQTEAQRKALQRQRETSTESQIRLRKNAERMAVRRQQETSTESQIRLRENAERVAVRRQRETSTESQIRLRESAERMALRRQRETSTESQIRLRENAERMAVRRQQETSTESQIRLRENAERMAVRRQQETSTESQIRLQESAERMAVRRQRETPEVKKARLQANAKRMAEERLSACASSAVQWNLSGFNYTSNRNYEFDSIVSIGSMSCICSLCGAKKWPSESPGLCCRNGKLQFSILLDPPEPLKSLLTGDTSDSTHFLKNIQAYNSAFCMTSFGSNIIREEGFMPTFKVKGQIYHRLGSLQPLANDQPKYLQLYFVGDMQRQAEFRSEENPATKMEILLQLQEMLHEHNPYIKTFKSAVEKINSTEYQIIIDADKRPPLERARRFNLPECNEIAVLIAGIEHGKRDTVIKTRDNKLQFIDETQKFI